MFVLIAGLWALCVASLISIAAFVWDELRDGTGLDLGGQQGTGGAVARQGAPQR